VQIADAVTAALKRRGVCILTAHRLVGAQPDGDQVRATLLDVTARAEVTVAAAHAVLATGRRPDSRDLGLDTVTVQTDRRGHLLVDGHCQTAEPGLYAVGDLLPTPDFDHVAAREALAAVGHACGQPLPPIRYRDLPLWLTCQPAIATVGISAAQAQAEGYSVRVSRVAIAGLETMVSPNGDGRLASAVFDRETGRLLGVHAVGPQATTLVLGAVAGLPLQEV
jgi:dihydrolipoamide dehydrogenase